MASTPKETTTKTEPWDGARPYLLEQYANFDKLIKDGAPQAYQGNTYNEQSKATKDSLSMAEQLARNGNTSVLNNATNAVNGVMNSTPNSQATNTLSQLQNGVNLGTNPTNSIASNIAKGTPSSGQTWTNGAAGNAAALQGYNNSAISSIQSMLGQTNPALAGAAGLQGYKNDAVGQAANLNGYTNAASGLQTAQANQLAAGNNPALDYLKGTASGANIGKNPYLDQVVSNQQDAIAKKLQDVTNPAISSQAASLGRMGSGAFASQLNNAQSTAANEMAKVATDMYGNQYNQDVANQMSAAGQVGNFYNSDVANQMNANQALSNTSNAQQSQRINGTQLYGSLNDSQQQANLAANQNYGSLANANAAQNLNAANSLSSANDSQQAARQSANQSYADILNSQQAARQSALNNDRNYQLAGLSQLSNNYQSNISNMLGLRDQQMNAANSQLSAQSTANGQKLQAAGMAGSTYQNSYLPSQMLAGVGQSRDAFNDLVLESKINAWDRAQQQPLQNIANFTNILNGGGYSNTTTPVYTNTGAQVLGGLSSLAGLFSLCDVREKILHGFLGYMPMLNGEKLAMFEFSYINDPNEERFVGPIAQEVEAKTGAVIEINNRKVIDVEAFMKEAA